MAEAPALGRRRGQTLASAAGEPVVFRSTPQFKADVSRIVAGYQRGLTRAAYPWDLVKNVLRRSKHVPGMARDVLLRDGYLYAEAPHLAFALYDQVTLESLFDDPRLVIERGSSSLRVIRKGDKYVYASGPQQGNAARLLLFDRVRVATQPTRPPLHLDVRRLAYDAHADRVVPELVSDRHVVARLRHGTAWSRALLTVKGARLSFDCEVPLDGARPDAGQVATAEAVATLAAARAAVHERRELVAAIKDAVLDQVDEALPFDEPERERGQQDGFLRPMWEQAYFAGRDRYVFNDVSYQVFDGAGRPKVPQVCIDFVTHTFERAGGGWFNGKGLPRGASAGRVSYDEILGAQRRRQIGVFLNHTREAKKDWDHWDLEGKDMIAYRSTRHFYRFLGSHADDFAPGDVVVIRGRARWDNYSTLHWHSFFVFEVDPVTGHPMQVAGNAGVPRVRPLDEEVRRTPQRSITQRLRPTTAFLRRIVDRDRAGARPRPILPGH